MMRCGSSNLPSSSKKTVTLSGGCLFAFVGIELPTSIKFPKEILILNQASQCIMRKHDALWQFESAQRNKPRFSNGICLAAKLRFAFIRFAQFILRGDTQSPLKHSPVRFFAFVGIELQTSK